MSQNLDPRVLRPPLWRLAAVGALFCVISFPGCGPKETEPLGDQPGGKKVQWSYHGDTGPAHWGDLAPEYSAAKDGKEQSPIHIYSPGAARAELPKLELAYASSVRLDVLNNGHTVQANVPSDAGALVIGEDNFTLHQFHFHAPSEHLVDDDEFAAEMHLVHATDDGTLAVVGVFIQEGAEHAELAKMWGDLPMPAANGHGEGEHKTVPGFDLNKILPADHATYRYPGSLTTPPCSEGVHWNLLAAPIEMSADQIAAFVKLFSGDEFPDGNRRPVQLLHGRTVDADVP